MPETIEKSIKTVFSGAFNLLAGFLLGGILTLAIKIIIARFFNPGLYGVFSQGLALMYALVMVSMVGMNAGSSRYISYQMEKDEEKALKAVPSSLLIVMPFSLVVFGTMFFMAEPIAGYFGDLRMIEIIKVFAFAGPAMAFNSIIISGFRGYQSSKERVILLDLVIPILQILGVSLLVLLGYGILGAAAGYITAFLITVVISGGWYLKDYPIKADLSVAVEIAEFSWPLMLSSVAVQIFLWSPPILVGIMSTSTDVGLLNSALPLGAATKMFLSSVAFLFLPVISEHYSRNEIDRIKRLHEITTSWVFIFALPTLVFVSFMSDQIISLIFGVEYIEAGIALSVMAVGYLVNAGTGPMGDLLIAVGNIKQELVANTLKLSAFLVTGVILIPSMGFLGGAIAFAVGMTGGNILRIWFGRKFIDPSYFRRKLLKPSIAVIPAILVSILFEGLYPNVIVNGAVFACIYLILLISLSPFTEEEKEAVIRFMENNGLEDREKLRGLVEIVLN